MVVYLDKESLLARLTTNHRSEQKQAVVDRFFELTGQRAYYVTDAYVVAEVVSAFRSQRGAHEALDLYADIKASDMLVQHGSDPWDEGELSTSPRGVMDAAAEFLAQYPKHDVSLQEAILVLQAKRGDDCLFSFDGPLRSLGRACGVSVYPVTEDVYLGS
ncbi:hypothetical protein SAMN05216559_2308 [Halomicrobium zhouii]|uniref:PIN domain-containing protein n=1 Tax=Halomicrobium zhouii TaxID=767519 RepID=A0A1I6L9G3_9EURY|nr:hypothetical protein SAMN05216559_2308 [Halomicrobium zhouii]